MDLIGGQDGRHLLTVIPDQRSGIGGGKLQGRPKAFRRLFARCSAAVSGLPWAISCRTNPWPRRRDWASDQTASMYGDWYINRWYM